MKKIYSFTSNEVFSILLEILYEQCLITKEQLEDEENEITLVKHKGNGNYELQVMIKKLG